MNENSPIHSNIALAIVIRAFYNNNVIIIIIIIIIIITIIVTLLNSEINQIFLVIYTQYTGLIR